MNISLIKYNRTKKTCFDLLKYADNNLEHETDSVMKHNEVLADHTIKNEVKQNYCAKISMETIFMNTKTVKGMNHINLVLTYYRLNLRSLNKYVAIQNLSIYYNWKNIRQQYKTN